MLTPEKSLMQFIVKRADGDATTTNSGAGTGEGTTTHGGGGTIVELPSAPKAK